VAKAKNFRELNTPNLWGIWNLYSDTGPVHLAYNPFYSAYFFSRDNIFFSQKINQQCFSAGL
jgi:hypothetical protein